MPVDVLLLRDSRRPRFSRAPPPPPPPPLPPSRSSRLSPKTGRTFRQTSASPLAREDATTTRRSTRAAASRSDIPDDGIPTTRRGIRQCGAKRVRARALLSAATESRQRFRGCTCWHGTAMWARIQTGREHTDRLVPPRLRRAAHLLTEYHRDSYIAMIMVHTPATRTAAGCSRERCCEVNPEASSRSLVSSRLVSSSSGRGDRDGGQLTATVAATATVSRHRARSSLGKFLRFSFSSLPVAHVNLLPSDFIVPGKKIAA